ncbi:glutamine-rich protein 2 [Tupaia chinensis]|uniref:glutamine-rich protein 2 n=1 Tax=Tupaia chinensis TaxID=246437 RepID=UPI0003C8E52A|nr:glutamine-rich protein 2 [Tupaia chinensis]
MPPSALTTTVSLRELADLAIGTPEVGAVNFTALHTLIVAMLKNLNLQDTRVDFQTPSPEPSRLLEGTRTSLSTPQLPAPREKRKGVARPPQTLESQVQDLGRQVKAIGGRVKGLLQHLASQAGGLDAGAREWVDLKDLGSLEPEKSQAMQLLQDVMQDVKKLKESQERAQEFLQGKPQEFLQRIGQLEKLVKDRDEFLDQVGRTLSLVPGEEATMVTWEELEQAITDGWKASQAGSDTSTGLPKHRRQTSLTSNDAGPGGVFTKYPSTDQTPDSASGLGPDQTLSGSSGTGYPSEGVTSGERSRDPSATGFSSRDQHPRAHDEAGTPRQYQPPASQLRESDRHRRKQPTPTHPRRDERDLRLSPAQQDITSAREWHDRVYPESHGGPIGQGQVYPRPGYHGLGPSGMGQPGVLYPTAYPHGVVPISMGQLGVIPPETDEQALGSLGIGQHGVVPPLVPGRDQQRLEIPSTGLHGMVPLSTYQHGVVFPGTDQRGMEQPGIQSGMGPLGMDQRGLIPLGMGQHGFVLGQDQHGLVPPGMGQQGLGLARVDRHGLVPPLTDQHRLVSPALMQVSADQQGAIQPHLETPGFIQPGSEWHDFIQPGAFQPGLVQPGADQPGVVQPGTDQSGLAQPGTDQSAVVQPGAEQRGLVQPRAYTPGLVQPGLVQHGLIQPGMDQHDLVQPGTDQPGLMQPSATQPGLIQPGTDQQGVVQPGAGQPHLVQPGTSLNLAQSGVSQPGLVQSGAYLPGLTQPGVYPPSLAQLGAGQVGLVQPGAYPLGLVQPGADQFGLAQPGTDQPGVVKPGAEQRGLMQPRAYTPGLVPGIDQHGVAHPRMDQHGLVQPDVYPTGWVQPDAYPSGLVQPGTYVSGLIQPATDPRGLVQSGVGRGGLVQPGVDQRGFVQPGADQRGLVQPGTGQLDLMQPGIDQRGLVQPVAGQVGMVQPFAGQVGMVQPGSDQRSLVQPVAGQVGMVQHGIGQRGLVQPGVGQVGMLQPGMDQHGLVQPGTGQVGMIQPDADQRGLVQPEMDQYGLVQPGMDQHGLVQPSASQVGMVQPGVDQRGLLQPVAGQVGVVQPGVDQRGLLQPGAGQVGMVQPGADQRGLLQPVAGQAGIMQPGADQRGLIQPVASQTGMVQPGTDQRGLMRPVTSQIGMVQPGADQRGSVQPGVGQVGMMQPSAGQRDLVQPSTDARGLVQPGVYMPGLVRPGAYPTGLVQPGAYPLGLVKPGAYPPRLVQPGTYHGLVQPSAYPPGLVQPGAVQRGLVQPGVYPYGSVQPGTDSQGLSQPGTYPRGLTEPGAYPRDLAQPGMDQRGVGQPGADQRGLIAPGTQLRGFPTFQADPQTFVSPYPYQPGVIPPIRPQHGQVSPLLASKSLILPGIDQRGLVLPEIYQRGLTLPGTNQRGPTPLGTRLGSVRPDQPQLVTPSPDQQGQEHPGTDQYGHAYPVSDYRGQMYPGYGGPGYPSANQYDQVDLDPNRIYASSRPGIPAQTVPGQDVTFPDSVSYLHQAPSEKSEVQGERRDSLEKVAPSFPLAVETLRLIGELTGLYVELKENMKDLDEEQAGQTDLEKIQYLLALMVKKSIPPDLQEQLKTLKSLTKEVRQEKAKLEKMQRLLETEAVQEGGKEVKTGQLSLQLGVLRVTVADIEKELAELRESQERGKVTIENSVSEASLYLQEQTDVLQAIIESMLTSSSTLLSMSMTPHKAPPHLTPGQIDPEATCPACSLDLSHQVSTLVQRYEQLQDMVNSLAASRPSKKAKLQSQDEELLGHVQSAILQVQGDCEKLNITTSNLIEDHRQKQKDIDVLYQGLEKLEKEKANREHLELEIDVKADKSALAAKVSRIQFDATTEKLNHMMQELVAKMSGQERDWQKMLDKLLAEMDSKLDRLELDPVKQMLEDRWKSLRQQLQERSPLYQADEAAAMRRQLLAHFHCLSCDRPLETPVTGQLIPVTPVGPGLPGHRSIRPYTVFELEQVRQQSRNLKLGSAFPRGDLVQMERSVGHLRSMHSKMLMDIEKVQIHFGGSVRASSQMIRELLHAHCLSSPCYKRLPDVADYTYSTMPRRCGGSHTLTYPSRRNRLQHLPQGLYAPEDVQLAMKHDEVDILGLDGHIYKGRMDTRLPGILTKDSSGIAKNKPKQPRPHVHRPQPLGNSSQLPSRPQSAQMLAANHSVSSSQRKDRDRPVSSEGRLSQTSAAHPPSPTEMANVQGNPAGLGMHMDLPPGEGLEEPTRGPRSTTAP